MKRTKTKQKIIVFQQNQSGESKIAGIREFGDPPFNISIVSIDEDLPILIDHTGPYLPSKIEADLILDFLKHPDLSQDLAVMARNLNIPMVASGKKIQMEGVYTPPT